MLSNVQHPGVTLLEGYLQPLGITPRDLARSLGLQMPSVSELLAGQRPITSDDAARLALFFDVPARWWLELQARYDAAQLGELEAWRNDVTPYEGLADVLVTPRGVRRLGTANKSVSVKSTLEKISDEFIARLRAQVELSNDNRRRKASQITFDDGTVALVGE